MSLGSRQDIARIMKIASSHDPEAAHDEEIEALNLEELERFKKWFHLFLRS
jgi:hypothetical protein